MLKRITISININFAIRMNELKFAFILRGLRKILMKSAVLWYKGIIDSSIDVVFISCMMWNINNTLNILSVQFVPIFRVVSLDQITNRDK